MFRVKSILAFAIAAAFAGTFATAASAGPLQLFPPLFGQQSIPQSAMSYNALPQDQMDRADRFKRQVVDYRTNEAPGTIIVDTPHTYLYFVLGNGRAIRYGIGVGREGFTWAGTQTISRKAEWPDWNSAAGNDPAATILAALYGRRTGKPAWRPRALSRRHRISHSWDQRPRDDRRTRLLGLHPPRQ